ncbi:hypothetical protein HK102_009553 [Quaeritorhiza haematococci]|nr:hypothetical protein HK102_009553 [Quaeritorhiza haematococci]
MRSYLKLILLAVVAVASFAFISTTPANADFFDADFLKGLGKANVKLYSSKISLIDDGQSPYQQWNGLVQIRSKSFSRQPKVEIHFADKDGNWSPSNVIKGWQFSGPFDIKDEGRIALYAFAKKLDEFPQGASAFKVVYKAGFGRKYVDDNEGKMYQVDVPAAEGKTEQQTEEQRA